MRKALLSLIDVPCCAERKVATLYYDLASITAVNSLRNICGGVFECFSGISIIFHCVEAH